MKKLIIIEATVLFAIIAVKIYIEKIAYFPLCYFRENYGIFCPSCNFTRCVIALSHFDIIGAIMYQPILAISIIYLFFINIIYIINTITGKKFLEKMYPKPWYLIIFALLLIIYALYMNISGKA